ncbi:zonadhesin-like [Periplaneta americana]|uniref:zonadhesin-like n=1 Tax=Periplaneta americana TaxID=6978 RepID=UPI0037E8827B
MAFAVLPVFLCALALANCVPVFPSFNSASGFAEKETSGNYYNQKFFSRDDSKIRHMSTTLLSNAASSSEFASAVSKPQLVENVAFVEPLLPVVESAYPYYEAPVIEPIFPVAEPLLPVIEPVSPIIETGYSISEPIFSLYEPLFPVVEPAVPIVEPVYPIVEPVYPIAEPVYPIVEPVYPIVEPVYPIVEPLYPVAESVYPFLESVYPIAEPIFPISESIVSIPEPVLPIVEPAYPFAELSAPYYRYPYVESIGKPVLSEFFYPEPVVSSYPVSESAFPFGIESVGPFYGPHFGVESKSFFNKPIVEPIRPYFPVPPIEPTFPLYKSSFGGYGEAFPLKFPGYYPPSFGGLKFPSSLKYKL